MKPNRSTWASIAEAPMAWDTSDVEPAVPTKRDPKRPPPVPGKALRGRQAEGAGDFGEEVWNVTDRLSGQTFSNIPGRTPMDAKKYVMRSNPRLQKMHPADLAADPASDPMRQRVEPEARPQAVGSSDQDRGSRWTKNPPIETGEFLRGHGFSSNGTEVTGEPAPIDVRTANLRGPRQAQGTPQRSRQPTQVGVAPPPTSPGRRPSGLSGDTFDDVAEPPTFADGPPTQVTRKREGATAGGSLAGFQVPHPEANEDELSERVFRRMLEIVRKKKGGGGFTLYGPNKGKKNPPKKLGDFPTRAAAKAAELARNPPKDSKELQRARKRVDKLRKDPKARARAEKNDLSGRKKLKRTGPPARARSKAKREDLARDLVRDIRERLFHEDELPGSPWDERIASMHPDHIAADRRLATHHKNMERASIGSLGAAGKALSSILRGMAKVHPGDVSKDVDHGKTFVPVMLDVGGTEVGPLHLYIDGGHVKIELSGDARQQISELEPDTARKLRGSLSTYEADHLPKISDARKAWTGRDRHMDDMHAKLQKHIAGMSDVERHLAKQLLKGKREN